MPRRLPEKLFYIRLHLALTQEQMVERLLAAMEAAGDDVLPLFPGHISEYERGEREPPLIVLLHYARLAQIPLEVLVDDGLSLPGGLHAKYMIMGIDSLKKRKRMKSYRSQQPK
ncbi:MAG: hypothetical protein DMF64_10700 [Acidobacteria bacterium]|nr:MAG: hypothetical protein DMF64_10700 [Acidobacteriota bacterium]